MFGLSFGEMVVLAVVALVVVGPRNLPTMMRTLGRTIGKLRKMALDLRAESGIDKILEAEGIQEEITNFRRLVSGDLMNLDDLDEDERRVLPSRECEYPRSGADCDSVVPEDEVAYLEPPAEQAASPAVPPETAAADAPAPVASVPPAAGPASPPPVGVPAPAADGPPAAPAPVPPGSVPRPSVPGAVPAANPFGRPVKNGTSPTS